MILAVDIGNTHVCFGFVNETSRVLSQFRIPTDLTETSFGYAAKMRSIFDFSRVSLEETEGAVISSVVPSVTVAMKEAVRLLISKEALVVGAGIRSGLKIAIDDPGTVASDLVATAVAAKAQYPLPCVIVDVGTATTVSYINRNAEFAGVSILPGVALGMAMTASTLPGGELTRNVVLFSVLIYELVGPALTKRSLLAVGEIKPEGRVSHRRHNTGHKFHLPHKHK